jgi:hypothetical protein
LLLFKKLVDAFGSLLSSVLRYNEVPISSFSVLEHSFGCAYIEIVHQKKQYPSSVARLADAEVFEGEHDLVGAKQCSERNLRCSTFANGFIFQNIRVPETGDTDGVYVRNAEVFEGEHALVGAKQCSERNLRCPTFANGFIFQNIRVPETGDTDGVYEFWVCLH